MLNKIWPIFIIISFSYAILCGKLDSLNSAIFESTSDAVSLSISLLGTICLWNGIIQVANKSSIIEILKTLFSSDLHAPVFFIILHYLPKKEIML